VTPNKSKLKTIIRDILLEIDNEDRWKRADETANKIVHALDDFLNEQTKG